MARRRDLIGWGGAKKAALGEGAVKRISPKRGRESHRKRNRIEWKESSGKLMNEDAF